MSHEISLDIFLYGVGTVCFLVLYAPLWFYIWNGLKIRKREILTSFNDEAIKAYFQTFFLSDYIECIIPVVAPNEPGKTDMQVQTSGNSETEEEDRKVDIDKLRRKFNSYFNESLGRKKFFLPCFILFVVTVFCIIYTIIALKPFLAEVLDPATTSYLHFNWYYHGAIAGFAGGYMWVTQFLISRMQQRRLSRADICWCFFRILISIPISLSIVAFIKTTIPGTPIILLCALCFMLGAFPTNSLMVFMRRIINSKINPQENTDENASVLIQLQGITKSQAEEFEKEGISTILQLAYADPIDLTIRTGFSFSYIVDCCSQALAWLSFEDNMKVLRKFGIRGAMEITTIELEYNRELEQDDEVTELEVIMADKTLDAIALELKMEKTVLRRTFYQVAWDPYAQFFYNIWQSEWN
jgi:hypothetical protein